MGFVYGPEASNVDVASRSLVPLIRKFVEGYNVTLVAFGATGTVWGRVDGVGRISLSLFFLVFICFCRANTMRRNHFQLQLLPAPLAYWKVPLPRIPPSVWPSVTLAGCLSALCQMQSSRTSRPLWPNSAIHGISG